MGKELPFFMLLRNLLHTNLNILNYVLNVIVYSYPNRFLKYMSRQGNIFIKHFLYGRHEKQVLYTLYKFHSSTLLGQEVLFLFTYE